MKLVVLLAVLTVGMCAPAGETEQTFELNDLESEEVRVKRAKEIMMFGNQQNAAAPDMAKRVDPSIEEDDKIDKGGLIVATEPTDLPDESNETPEDTNDEANHADSSEAETNNQELRDESADEISEQDEIPVDNTDIVPVGADNAEDDQMSFEDFLKDRSGYGLSELLKGKVPQYRDWQPFDAFDFPYSKYGRRRRSQMRTFNGYPYQAARMLKRSHRTKRHTYDSDDFDFYLPYEMPYNYQMDDDDMAELLDLLETPEPYDDNDVFVNPYETYAPYEETNGLEFESPIYVAPKRQAGLTFVPGIKRSLDFYPFFKEPETHFANFIPEKRSMREYADAYQRVMELAAALRQQEEPYPSDYYEGYRKRK